MRRCSYSSGLAIVAAPAAKSDGEGRKRASHSSISVSSSIISLSSVASCESSSNGIDHVEKENLCEVLQACNALLNKT
jgi:hypothetical protein